MKVAADVRGLGAHLNVHAAARRGNAVEMIGRALSVIQRFASLSTVSKKKTLALKTKVWPMALYGCEATASPKAQGK
eukprot:14260151-Alexandrium_andersonii.AAC.1